MNKFQGLIFINNAAKCIRVDEGMRVPDKKFNFKVENTGLALISAFQLIVGAVCFLVLAADMRLIHVGLIGIFSLITAYGVITKRFWVMWVAIIMFFMATAFCIIMLYFQFGKDVISNVVFAAYLLLTWISTAYVASKRKALKARIA